jgi:hypothetical protein
MPMHDWTRVGAGIYHDFHTVWLTAIRHALNNGVLPGTHYAMVEQVTVGVEADILALQGPSPPSPRPGGGVATLTATQPAVGVLERAEKAVRKRPGRRVTVRHVSNHKVVAILELVSPGNIEGRREYARFVAKSAAILSLGIHLVVIDPFVPPAHSPLGLHASIWARAVKKRKGKTPAVLPPDRPLMAAGYAAGTEVVAALQPFAVGEAVPDVPLFLTPEQEYVTLPLEPTYAAAFPDVPRVWREVLEA